MSPKLLPELKDQHGLVVIMFPNDHLPPHVHVYQSEKVARIQFETTQPQVMDSDGFRQKELNTICDLIKPYRAQLIDQWNEMHPDLKVSPDNPGEEI
jgi:hypothetical protein